MTPYEIIVVSNIGVTLLFGGISLIDRAFHRREDQKLSKAKDQWTIEGEFSPHLPLQAQVNDLRDHLKELDRRCDDYRIELTRTTTAAQIRTQRLSTLEERIDRVMALLDRRTTPDRRHDEVSGD